MTKDHTVSQDDSGLGKEGLSPSVARNDARDAKSNVEGRGGSAAWEGGKCRVPMWSMGVPAGFCDEHGYGPQLPKRVLIHDRARPDWPYCGPGACCPKHGGPREGDPIIFRDGLTSEGRPMWCAVMPGFVDLQESVAAFDADPLRARALLLAAIAKATSDPSPLSAQLGATANDQGREEPK